MRDIAGSEPFEIVPFDKHHRERLPNLQIVNRGVKSPEIKATLSVLGLIGDCHYVEIFANKSRTAIKLIPVKKQTAFSRGVASDMISHCRIAGGSKLVEMGYKFGKYDMVAPMVFKYVSRSVK